MTSSDLPLSRAGRLHRVPLGDALRSEALERLHHLRLQHARRRPRWLHHEARSRPGARPPRPTPSDSFGLPRTPSASFGLLPPPSASFSVLLPPSASIGGLSFTAALPSLIHSLLPSLPSCAQALDGQMPEAEINTMLTHADASGKVSFQVSACSLTAPPAKPPPMTSHDLP